MTTNPIRVGIVDDHDLFREGLVALLARNRRIEVIGQARDSQTAVDLVRDHTPDVLLLDVSMPGDPARITIARIRRAHSATRVVILTMHQDALLRKELLSAGASAYLTKTAPSDQLVSAILFSATADLSDASGTDTPDGSSSILSNREHEVMRLIAQARSNREIAKELSIAEGTVKRHANSIYSKLDATSRIDATRKAVRLGILQPSAQTP